MKNYRLKFKILNFALSFCILIFAFYIFTATPVFAAEIFFEPKTQEIAIDQQFQVDMMLDAEDEEINAVEGKIVFPSDILELKEIRDGDSIVNLWVERPQIEKDGLIVFSGIIPGGFKGVLSPYYEGYRPGKVFSLIFTAKGVGKDAIEASPKMLFLDHLF